MSIGAGGMVQQLRALAVLSDDSVTTYQLSLPVTPVPGDPVLYFGLHRL